jgi:hypothetical protein
LVLLVVVVVVVEQQSQQEQQQQQVSMETGLDTVPKGEKLYSLTRTNLITKRYWRVSVC